MQEKASSSLPSPSLSPENIVPLSLDSRSKVWVRLSHLLQFFLQKDVSQYKSDATTSRTAENAYGESRVLGNAAAYTSAMPAVLLQTWMASRRAQNAAHICDSSAFA